MRDMFKTLFGHGGSDKLRIDEYQLDEWKETLGRFLRFEPEYDFFSVRSIKIPAQNAEGNREYDNCFALCCDRFCRFEELRSPENQANQLFSACYARNGIEETLRRALIFTEKIRPEDNAEEAAQMLHDHFICLLRRLTQDALHAYDTWPYDPRRVGMDESEVLQFIRAECPDALGISSVPRAWETLAAIEREGKTDKKTWLWLSNAMEEFDCRGMGLDSLKAVAARIDELTQKRVRIIERGETLRAFFKETLTPDFFDAFDPARSPVTADAAAFAARAQEALSRVLAAYAKACGTDA